MADTNAQYFVDLVAKYRTIMDDYGPFQWGVSQEDAAEAPPELVWSLIDVPSGGGYTVLAQGLVTNCIVYDYAFATKPVTVLGENISAIEVIWITCPVCGGGGISEPDSCERCETHGTLFLDIEEIAFDLDLEVTEEYVLSQFQAS